MKLETTDKVSFKCRSLRPSSSCSFWVQGMRMALMRRLQCEDIAQELILRLLTPTHLKTKTLLKVTDIGGEDGTETRYKNMVDWHCIISTLSTRNMHVSVAGSQRSRSVGTPVLLWLPLRYRSTLRKHSDIRLRLCSVMKGERVSFPRSPDMR
jgi:hypothetical protein